MVKILADMEKGRKLGENARGRRHSLTFFAFPKTFIEVSECVIAGYDCKATIGKVKRDLWGPKTTQMATEYLLNGNNDSYGTGIRQINFPISWS